MSLAAALGGLVAVANPDGTRPGLRPEDVTPGVIGFLVTLALVLACIPLFRSMTRKMRGVAVRADAQVSDAAQSSAAASSSDGAPSEAAGSPDQGDEGAAGRGRSDGAHPVA